VNFESGFESRFIKTRIRLACICWLEFGSSNLPEINMAHSLLNFCHPVVQRIQEGTFTLCAIMKASKNMKSEKEPYGEAPTAGTNSFC